MSLETIPRTTSFEWIFPNDEKPLHKELVTGHTTKGIMEVWYSVRECSWFDTSCNRVSVVNWKKVRPILGQEHLMETKFFKRNSHAKT